MSKINKPRQFVIKEITSNDQFEINRSYIRAAKYEFQQYMAGEPPAYESVKLVDIKNKNSIKRYIFKNENIKKKYETITEPLENFVYFELPLPDDITTSIGTFFEKGGNKTKSKNNKQRKTKKQYKNNSSS